MTEVPIVLAVDLDEVVFKYIDGFRNWLREQRGVIVPEGEPRTWSLMESGWFPSEEDFIKTHGEAVDDGIYERLELLPDSIKTLWDLSNSGYQLNIITSRFILPGQNQKVVKQTVQALDDNRIPYSNISFLSNKVLQAADAYIDDSPKNVANLTAADRFVIRRNMAYNQGVQAAAQADTWVEIREILRSRFGC